jgi:hypothetical protein
MPKLQPLLYVALSLFLLAGVAAFFFQSGFALRTDGEIDYGEGIVFWQAAHVTDWKHAFHPIEQYPHIVFHYPPLFHLTSRVVALGTRNLLTAGRLTSILSLIGTCLIAGLLTWRLLPPGPSKAGRFVGALTAGTLVFATPLWSWACLMRVDTLGIFFSLAGIALFILARRRRALGFLAFVCFVAAVYCKQTAMAAPIACFLLALIERPRYALQLGAFSVALGLVFLCMLYRATDGLILRHLITYNQNPYFPGEILGRLSYHGSDLVGPLFFSVMFPVVLLYRRKGRQIGFIRRLRLILKRSLFERCVLIVAVYFLFTALIAAATICKQGASDNYFLEMDVVACLLSGLFVAWLARRVSFHPRRALVLLQIVVVFILLVQTAVNWRTLNITANRFMHPPADRSADVVNYLKTVPDPVYSEDMVVLMHAGREIPAEPAIITALADDGKWDESGFVARIRNGEFRAIVVRWSLTNRGRFTKGVADAVEERYYLTNDLEPFKLYLPKQQEVTKLKP